MITLQSDENTTAPIVFNNTCSSTALTKVNINKVNWLKTLYKLRFLDLDNNK